MNTVEPLVASTGVAVLVAASLALLWLPTRRDPLRSFEPSPHRATAPDTQKDPVPVSAGVLVELVASMLDAGVPVERSLTVLGSTVDGPAGSALRTVGAGLSLGLPWRQAWAAAATPPMAVRDLRAALTFAAVSGAPSSSALRAASAQVRRAEHRRAEAAAEKLAVHLVVPLGLCSLPAFIAWGIVPVLIGLVPDFF
ncbi:type II secretion system F family protein [Kocuria sp.]|uniref:type II secretion system F family protein n=1 Tax=Kocuria sp. TaxID=1871328 RepID=UPI0026DEE94B|nr:type II secretion system F family protein [Kocuria sp.]MDO5618564.1 type II secretion system F family protein [Kocuria sp.]